MHEVIAKVFEILEKVEAKIEELRNKINSVLSGVPGFLSYIVDKVLSAWNAFMDKLQQFWDWFTDKLAQAGDPGALDAAVQSWHAHVGGPVSAQSQQVDAGDLLVDDNWTGDAADQYRQKFPDQKTSMESIRDEFVNNITLGLDTIRAGIIVFWGAIVTALLALAAGIVGALTATGTIIGLPAAPVIAGAAMVVCLGALGVGVSILNSTASSANNRMAQAASFGSDTWPAFALT